ncbi:hypothetical protein [Pelagicoccus sp. SDUM812002]|uniref:hypothetical protein n=1 Tax=Pelagicoccus sp. SDUM812002 TaxID=3041266 RepID=UPI00280CE13F|nr:hypothetical protein [Pelagicoccus sp. SDUM812002]MDQ8185825.1 hypothetical protein [Pelagicoccus sp. SDUM812002]
MNKIRIALLTFSLAAAASLTSLAQAAHSEDEAVKVVQSSKYNVFTGNWDVELDDDARSLAEDFRMQMPNLDYHLVDEETVVKKNSARTVLTFRGDGDQRVIVKLKEIPEGTNVRLRVGMAGSEAKSAELFKYVFMRM